MDAGLLSSGAALEGFSSSGSTAFLMESVGERDPEEGSFADSIVFASFAEDLAAAFSTPWLESIGSAKPAISGMERTGGSEISLGDAMVGSFRFLSNLSVEFNLRERGLSKIERIEGMIFSSKAAPFSAMSFVRSGGIYGVIGELGGKEKSLTNAAIS